MSTHPFHRVVGAAGSGSSAELPPKHRRDCRYARRSDNTIMPRPEIAGTLGINLVSLLSTIVRGAAR